MKNSEPKFQTAYGPKKRPVITCNQDKRADQSFKKECDMKWILDRFQKTGVITHTSRYAGQYGNIPAMDYEKSQILVATAKTQFAELPSELREHFGQSVTAYLDFAAEHGENTPEVLSGILSGDAEGEPEPPLETSPAGSGEPETPETGDA